VAQVPIKTLFISIFFDQDALHFENTNEFLATNDYLEPAFQVPIKTLFISIFGALEAYWAIVFATGKVLTPKP
jgi:hypothetical protein